MHEELDEAAESEESALAFSTIPMLVFIPITLSPTLLASARDRLSALKCMISGMPLP